MKTKLTGVVIASSIMAATTAQAQDDQDYMIFVRDDQASPMVTPDLVQGMGAANLLSLLGEQYVVTGRNEIMALVPSEEVEPIVLPGIGIPGIPPGILPTCQCPEGYVSALTDRMQSRDLVFDPALVNHFSTGPGEAVVLTPEQITDLLDQGITIEAVIQPAPTE
ncbi:MAG: hypothetical protein ACK5LJ_11705 [Paracoccus sp. (in: a-proteobacteria)]